MIDTTHYSYTPISDQLMMASRITNRETGQTLDLNLSHKMLYAKMMKRYDFFMQEGNKGIYYDNIDQLALAVGLKERMTINLMNDLKKVGLVISTRSGRSNNWKVEEIHPDKWLMEIEVKKGEYLDVLTYNPFKPVSNPAELQTQKKPEQETPPAKVAVPDQASVKQSAVNAEQKGSVSKSRPAVKQKISPESEKAITNMQASPVYIRTYRAEFENPDRKIPESQHGAIGWMLENGLLDTSKNPKLLSLMH